jgi:1-deoxy-D-xylulose-5-phosphate synthase
MLPIALQSAEKLQAAGLSAGVVNARFIKPVDRDLLKEQSDNGASRFVTIENGALAGGFGSAVREALADISVGIPVRSFGWDDAFVEQGEISQLLEAAGLTADSIARQIIDRDQSLNCQ